MSRIILSRLPSGEWRVKVSGGLLDVTEAEAVARLLAHAGLVAACERVITESIMQSDEDEGPEGSGPQITWGAIRAIRAALGSATDVQP